jgi:hypothetical protein
VKVIRRVVDSGVFNPDLYADLGTAVSSIRSKNLLRVIAGERRPGRKRRFITSPSDSSTSPPLMSVEPSRSGRWTTWPFPATWPHWVAEIGRVIADRLLGLEGQKAAARPA